MYEIDIIYKTYLLLTTGEFLENDLVEFEKKQKHNTISSVFKKRVAYSKVKTHSILYYTTYLPMD